MPPSPVPDLLRDRLQSSLGTAYTLERELGGGGMSRVFLARDVALGRDVVVKVLAPEYAASLSAERFTREIRLAASLQQANIVPLLSAGALGELPYYTMPYVAGESLRHRLGRGPLGAGEVVAVLRDVAKALAYAHARDIVHRDIKPDNVLLSGGTAVVTDFGIAKALGAARTNGNGAAPTTGGALTAHGAAIGTPAYMAPEQAAADPDADHRVDVYAFGCLAYELLAGVPPFHGLSPHRLLAAHMGERPRPVQELRPDAPAALAHLIARCLEKEPGARPADADELLRALDAVQTSGSGAAMPALLLGGPAAFRRALLLYAGAFVAVALLAKAAIVGIGLPDWVFPGALVAAGLALPMVLLTGYAQRVTRRAATMTPTYTPNGSPATRHDTVARLALKASPHLSWRRTARWGASAVAGFALLVAGAMALGALGVGPFGTLFAAGAMRADDAVVVADFASPGDSTLGRAIAQGVKADLAQSRAVQIVDDATIAEVLRRMERGDGDGPLTRDVARDAAQRAGAKMVVDGSVRPLGAGFLVSLSLVTADSGREVVTYQASVDSPGELIGAVGRLTRKLRARIGESLRDVRASPRLEAVTTPSLAALRKYTEARWALYHDLNQPKFVRLMREAIALDTSFAMAYQALAQELSLRGNPSEAARLIARAYPLRERLPAREQRLIEYGYFRYGPREVRDAARSHAAILAAAADPSDRGQSLNTVGSAFEWTGQFAQAESVTRLAIARDSTNAFPRGNLFHLLMQRGRLAEAESLHADFRRRFPAKDQGSLGRGEIALMLAAHGLTDSAEATLRNELAGTTDPIAVTSLTGNLGTLLGMLGRVREYEATMGRLRVARRANGLTYGDLVGAVNRARYHALTVGDRERARHILDSALARGPTDSVDALDRPNASLATAYAAAGDPASARRHLAGVEQQGLTGRDPVLADQVRAARAYIAIAERRWDDAIREARLARAGNCQLCGYLPLALAYDGRGDVDSAIAVFERTRADLLRYELNRGPVLRRLGELYEAKGDLAKAIDRYERFVALWRRADPELQPQVAEVRARVARLQAREGRTR